MFSIFRKHDDSSPAGAASTLMPRRMDLEERKAFRRELIDQVIRESLRSMAVPTDHFRLRLMPVDARHHRFIAMLDVAREFEPRHAGRVCELEAVEVLICQGAWERFGLTIEGIYWRVGARTGSQPHGLVRSTSSAPAVGTERRPWQLVSEEEKQALMDAIRLGNEMPVLHVGDWEYQTDMTPLDEEQAARGPAD